MCEWIFSFLIALLQRVLDTSEVTFIQVLIGLGVVIIILLIMVILGIKLWLIPSLKSTIIVRVPQNAGNDETNTEIRLIIKKQAANNKLGGSS